MSSTETRTVVIEREFPHSPERLWHALTQRALIAEWLMENDFEPKVGHKFTLRSKPVPNWNGVVDCEVLVIEPVKRLTYSWGALGLESAVTFTLTPTKTGVHLRMEQTGFRPDQPQAYNGATYGWQRFFGTLEKVLEKID